MSDFLDRLTFGVAFSIVLMMGAVTRSIAQPQRSQAATRPTSPTPLKATTVDKPRLNAIIEQLRAQEKKVRNLRVASETWQETCAEGQDRWERTPVCYAGVAWFTGLPGVYGRVDVRKQVLP